MHGVLHVHVLQDESAWPLGRPTVKSEGNIGARDACPGNERSAAQRIWHTEDSQGQVLALAFRSRSLNRFKVFHLRPDAAREERLVASVDHGHVSVAVNRSLTILNPHPDACNPYTHIPTPQTPNFKPQTSNPKLQGSDSNPQTLNSTP